MRGTLLSVVVVFLAATPASAAIDYGGQNRQVATSAGPLGSPAADSDVDDETATGFWSASVASSYSDNPPAGGGGNASASATQVSDLGDLEISMAGDLAGAGAGNDPPDFGGYVGYASSLLTATFTLDSDSPYLSTLATTGDTATTFSFSSATASYDANSSGVLPSGFYSLLVVFEVSNSGLAGGVSGAYAYNLTLVPEPSSACLILMGALLAAAPGRRNRRR